MQTQLKVRTEFSFRNTYGPIEKVVTKLKQTGCQAAAITDRSSTFGHFQWNKHCKKAGIKPIFGVELAFTSDVTLREKKQPTYWLSLLARSTSGLREIYSAVEEATGNFYYVPRLPISKLQDFSQDIIILSGNSGVNNFPLPKHAFAEGHRATQYSLLAQNRIVPVSDNYMIDANNRPVYEVLIGRGAFNRPSPMHIMDEWELRSDFDPVDDDSHFELANTLANECNAEIIPAENIKYNSNVTLYDLCIAGAQERELELTEDYRARLKRELELIAEKKYEDYFFVIADMINYAKQHMVVGPARGSSCGSLVCYLLGITDIDPLPHKLIFERFIVVTRYYLPDIDIDFQDSKRDMVFDYLANKYGQENVARLGTVSRYKAKSAIGETAKILNIPQWEAKQLKDSMITRSSGDSRAGFCIIDTLNETEVGKFLLKKYPAMAVAADMENHARHHGKHAAGVIITNEPINKYVARDQRTNTVQIDKYDAETINLMKIDALGLKTLSIIADCLESIGWTIKNLHKHPLDDDAAFAVLRDRMWCGIFQFEGQALQSIARRVNIDRFTDISALTALARPGPFASGAANEWVMRRMGRRPVEHLHSSTEQICADTYGIIVYQEQVMRVVREIGLLSWEDTSTLRKAMSKSFGVEYFDRYLQKFKAGAVTLGINDEEATKIWNNVNTMGSWAFNLSHAVAYGMLSYWCCVLKAHFPLEFALATIRNTHDVGSVKRYLRELDRKGISFKPYDAQLSEENWSIKDGQLIGGLTNVKGIGPKKAAIILRKRQEGITDFPMLVNAETPFDNVFEVRTRFADLLADPKKHNIKSKLWEIMDIKEAEGRYVFIAKLGKINERSLNEAMFLVQRNNVKVMNDKWLNLIVEDDTASIPVTISRFKFPSLGLPILKQYKEGDWFLWAGTMKEGTRRIFAERYKFLGSASEKETQSYQ